MPNSDGLIGNVIGAYQAGQGQYDQRRRRNALAQYAESQVPLPQTTALSVNALYPNGPSAPATAITSGPLPPAAPAGTPAGPANTQNAFLPTALQPNGARQNDGRRSALAELARLGDFETANSLAQFDDRSRADTTREAIAPMIREGQYGGAAREAAASGQTDVAQQLFQLDASQLQMTQRRGQQGAAAIYAALGLPAAQRASYMQQHRQVAMDAGVPEEAFDAADWNDEATLRALADSWLETSKLAGDVSLQKFGDNVQTVRTGRTGSEVLDSRAIPETRAESFDRQKFGYQQQQDSIDNEYRQSRAEAEDTYRRWQMDNSVGRSDIEGQVLQKAIRGGYSALSPEERQVYDRAVATNQGGGFGSILGGAPAGQGGGGPASTYAAPMQPSPSAPPPQQTQQQGPSGGGTQQNPARPRTIAEAQALPPGTFFYDPSGNLIQKQ